MIVHINVFLLVLSDIGLVFGGMIVGREIEQMKPTPEEKAMSKLHKLIRKKRKKKDACEEQDTNHSGNIN